MPHMSPTVQELFLRSYDFQQQEVLCQEVEEEGRCDLAHLYRPELTVKVHYFVQVKAEYEYSLLELAEL